MNIDIQTSGISASAGLRRFVRRRIDFAFSTRSDQIGRILVRLADVNGPRGGDDKSCLVQVRIPGQPDVIIENIESNLYVAIHRAIDRAGWTAARKLERQRRKARARLIIEQHVSDRREPERAA